MKKVVVIEDQTILRDLVCEHLLKKCSFLQLVGATGDGMEGYNLCIKHKPEFVILDIMLPILHGVEILERLKRIIPHIKILIFSSVQSSSIVKKVLELKVDGYIDKLESIQELEKAILQVANGNSYFSSAIVEVMRDLTLNVGQDDSLYSLSSREREIMKLIAEGYSSKEVSEKLYISSRTVDTHRMNIMKKLKLNDIAGLTRYAMAHGLIEIVTAN